MSSLVAVPPESELPEPMSFGARFTGIFLSPGSTFEDIARKPGWLAPLIVLVTSAVIFIEAVLWKIGMDRIVRSGLALNPRTAQMTPEQIEQAVTQGAKIGGITMQVFAVLGPPIVVLIIAGLGLLLVNPILGKDLKFATALAVTCYARLPSILGLLMGLVMIFVGDVEHFNLQNSVPTSLGFFLNPLETSKPLYALASSIDILTVWFLILLGIGFSAATGRKVKAWTVFGYYVGLWIVWVLIMVGLASL